MGVDKCGMMGDDKCWKAISSTNEVFGEKSCVTKHHVIKYRLVSVFP